MQNGLLCARTNPQLPLLSSDVSASCGTNFTDQIYISSHRGEKMAFASAKMPVHVNKTSFHAEKMSFASAKILVHAEKMSFASAKILVHAEKMSFHVSKNAPCTGRDSRFLHDYPLSAVHMNLTE